MKVHSITSDVEITKIDFAECMQLSLSQGSIKNSNSLPTLWIRDVFQCFCI